MPTAEEHLEQWKHNRRFVATIDPAYRDWQITVIFYAALHLVDADLAKLNVPVSNHETRNSAIRSNAALASIRNQYLNLYRISKVTRYDADPDKWLPRQYLTASDLATDLLRPIVTEVEKILGRKLDGTPPIKS